MSKVVNSEDFSVMHWQANVTAQIVSASISFLASLLIVACTSNSIFSVQRNSKHDEIPPEKNKNEVNNQNTPRLKKKKKTTSPYRRIIFLISASDILHSLAFITGPFMAQKTNPQALWAVNVSNDECIVNGIFFTVGASTSLLYYATLCYFYYCKISKRMTDEQFTRTFELKIHIMIAVICIASACLGLAAKTYNTSPTGTFCAYSNTPTGCNQQPEIYGECDAKVKVYIPYFVCFRVIAQVFSIVVMLYSMIRLIHSVLKKDRMYGELPSNPSQDQLYKYNVRKQLLRETMFQAIMYTGSWLICQTVTMTMGFLYFIGVSHENFPSVLQVVVFAFLPLNGAVNVFIYTRPAVRHVRRVDPSISRFRAFLMVLQAGGEAPNIEQRSTSTNHQLHQQQPSDMSSREPFGYDFFDVNDLCLSLDSLNNASSVDLRVMISEDLVARVDVLTWSGQDPSNTNITSNSKIRCLEDGSFCEDVKEYSHYYDPRQKLGGKNGKDPSNTNMIIASNSKIHCVEDAPFAKDVNEYNHYDFNMLERSGGI
ncbi:hypothetical protein CTEN210_06632 [Chaetoceros tenuissimus]|uniref:G-protein coupled receptors family 1 profile domain-containing protein n=1 Tax=Chaetoceros tenuissimus TaxID=426638 RepID=A0AAD3CQ70_9STRA|nr:hypothetical protein CTEN210_06632 [Chaetoceros tenuissimus]